MAIATIAEASREIAARKISPVELTQICLDRIEALDSQLNSFIKVTPERAMNDARAAEQRQMDGAARGPLDGIPIGHKDIYGTAGIATTAHSKLLQNWVPDTDATAVRLLHEAGTVMWASSRRMNSRSAVQASTYPGRRRATHGIRTISPPAPRRGPVRRSRPG